MEIEIIGSIDGNPHYNEEQISSLLQKDQTELKYGEAFMGRPGTNIFVGQAEVVKLRTELDLNLKSARDYVNHALEREQKIQVHHPQKTWFLLKVENDKYKVGNICLRLNPLHKLVNESEPPSAEQNLLYFRELYRSYFYVASSFNLCLDAGLSNFGIDKNNQLYYLDDDLYSWDRFISFAHVMGVLIRGNSWLDESGAQTFGNDLLQLIGEYFEDNHTSIMIAGKLRDIFMPDNSRGRVLDIIIQQLQSGKMISKRHENKHRYLAIFADVHANLPALDAVLNFLKSENISQGIVLGDIVGYGPHPGACIERLQDTGFSVIKGNHDHATATGDTTRGMSANARWCIDWTIPRLNPEHLKWLADLPLELSNSDESSIIWQAVHGAPMDPSYFYAYVYEMTYTKNLDVMAKRGIDLCFHGHTHIQGMYSRKKGVSDAFYDQQEQALDSFTHSLICPGSVGQPRNKKTGAQLAIYDQRSNEIRFHTVDYSMDKALQDMQEHKFPDTLIKRLRGGY